jgi:hypothetical protein
MNIGDRVKVIGQDIKGTIVEEWGSKVVIEEDESEYSENRLEFRISDVELLKRFKVFAHYTTQLDVIIEAVSEDDALEIADELDGGEFKDRGCGDWQIDGAYLIKEQQHETI